MKIILLLLSFLSFSAIAQEQPILEKISGTGFVPAEWSRQQKCQIFENEVLMTRSYGFTTVNYQIPFSSDGSLREMIAKASEEAFTVEPNGLCDGPSTVVKASIALEGHTEMRELILYSTGGCGSPRKVRRGPYTAALMDIAGTFCPTTH